MDASPANLTVTARAGYHRQGSLIVALTVLLV